ncbi:hypothetical protein BCR36DRAFT_412751 [Piromyces finnis]|uniref:Uncharacterized protein n=1 Tax=Piromyces finnis TaxID=1754191 RepID=A0A1Y1V8A1_9FUNG|nr:hypothetical protein BCR36DRAFT_412751 [Piromyces finnis]|eukprot:ORX49231.1 hypothetical protein BCR36DRAFT_412751 [Piromyces finnis]
MLKLNDNSSTTTTSKEKEIELHNLLILEKKQNEKKEGNKSFHNSNNISNNKSPPLRKTTEDIKNESDELKVKLQESYKLIRKLKEKLIFSEQKYESKLIREQEKFCNAEKKISQLEYELVNSRLNKPKNNEEIIHENRNTSTTTSPSPVPLSPPILSKVNPSSHIESFNLKPPLPSNLSKAKSQSNGILSQPNVSSKPLRSIKSANSSSTPLQPDNNIPIHSFNDPTTTTTTSIFDSSSTNNLTSNSTTISSTSTTSTTTSSTPTSPFLQKKQFNGTTATIHYLELKLNEKDKEIAVIKDNYEKTLKNLRSNLSKVKMESAIEIFELKNKIKELESQLINDNDLLGSNSSSNINDKNYFISHHELMDGRRSSLSLSTSSSDDDEDDIHKDNDEVNTNSLNEIKNENTKILEDQHHRKSPMIPRPPSQKLNIPIENNHFDPHNANPMKSSASSSSSLSSTPSSNIIPNLTSSKTKILRNNKNIRSPPSQLLPSSSSASLSSSSSIADLNTKELTSGGIGHFSLKGNYDLQLQKYKTKIKNLQDQLNTKNQLILDLSLQLSSSNNEN